MLWKLADNPQLDGGLTVASPVDLISLIECGYSEKSSQSSTLIDTHLKLSSRNVPLDVKCDW